MTPPPSPCPICGLDWSAVNPADGVVALRSFPRRYGAAFGAIGEEDDVDALLRRRPEPATWSALEYGAHVRGGLELYEERIERALADPGAAVPSVPLEDDPWAGHDAGDEPAVVIEGIAEAAERLADTAARVPDDGWHRSVVRDDGTEQDVLGMLRLAVHEGSHHLRDIEQVVRRVRAQVA